MAIPPVLIQFATGGVQDVDRAFASIEQRMIRSEQAGVKESEKAAQTRVRIAKQEAEARERALGGVAAARTRTEGEGTKETERQAKQMDAIRRRSAEMAGREAEKEVNKEIRERERAVKDAERQAKRMDGIRMRSAEMAGRAAEAEVRAEESARQRVSRAIGHATTRGAGHALGSAASLAVGGLAIGGGFALADVASKELAAQRTAALLVNAVTTGTAPPPGANVGNILSQAGAVSKETGMGKGELIAGTLEYSRKARGGDFAGAMANMGFFAKLAKTTGTDINEIAASAGTLQSQNQKLTAPEMQQMLLDVYAQGKAGSMSMIDVAKQIGVLGSTRSSYSGDAATNQRKLLALGQLAAPEGTVDEAGTFIKNLSMEAGKHRASTKEMEGIESMSQRTLGHSIYNKYGQIESPEALVSSVMGGTGGDITKIEKMFGARGTALFRSLQPAYVAAGGGDAGLKAVQDKMSSVTGATMTAGSLEAQFQQLMSTPAERFQKALNDLSEVASERVEPILERLAGALERNKDSVEKFMTGILDIAEWLIANPWSGLGTAVTLSITKELASAAIGEVVGRALTTRIGQGGGIVAAAAAITITGMAIIDWLANKDVQDQRNLVGQTLGSTNLLSQVNADVRSGKVTPADVANVQKEIAKQEAAKKKLEGDEDIWSGTAGGIMPLLHKMGFDDAGAARHKSEMEAVTRNLQDLNRELGRAKAALSGLGGAAARVPDPARSVPVGAPGRS